MIFNSNEIIYFIKILIFSIFTYYISIKISNKNTFVIKKYKGMFIISSVIIAIICKVIESLSGNIITLYMIIFMLISYSLITKENLEYSILIIIISFAINQIMFYIATMISFIPNFIFNIENKYINFTIIMSIYMVLTLKLMRVKRIKNGFSFLNKNSKNDFLNIIILSSSNIVLFTVIILSNYKEKVTVNLMLALILFSIIMFVTIQKSLQLYYKQKMLVKDLEETKEELEEKNNKIKELEKEIIKSGKRSHSISHRQKILEHKLEELSMKSEISEMDIKSRIEKIGKDIRKEPVIVLAKTGIVEIDDVLNYMKSECLKKKIDFQLQLSGNIYKMINNYVSKDELEILLADHIKNAIIAIEYSENINKSILVRLGRLDGTYGLYVYDSGIEFEIETFLKLGKKPATTHKDSGGTGMGFMNTFDTLRKHNASFIIEEYGKPVTDNFTKVLKFKFDNKNEFKICTYRKEEIEKQDKEKILKVENLMF